MALTTNELFSRIKPSQIREFDELIPQRGRLHSDDDRRTGF
jgi:hypothetical protein